MSISVGDIVSYGDYTILPIEQRGGFIARVKRKDGRSFTTASHMPHHLHEHADTMLFSAKDEAIENGKLIVDASAV